jgi:hypothetical protein
MFFPEGITGTSIRSGAVDDMAETGNCHITWMIQRGAWHFTGETRMLVYLSRRAFVAHAGHSLAGWTRNPKEKVHSPTFRGSVVGDLRDGRRCAVGDRLHILMKVLWGDDHEVLMTSRLIGLSWTGLASICMHFKAHNAALPLNPVKERVERALTVAGIRSQEWNAWGNQVAKHLSCQLSAPLSYIYIYIYLYYTVHILYIIQYIYILYSTTR